MLQIYEMKYAENCTLRKSVFFLSVQNVLLYLVLLANIHIYYVVMLLRISNYGLMLFLVVLIDCEGTACVGIIMIAE